MIPRKQSAARPSSRRLPADYDPSTRFAKIRPLPYGDPPGTAPSTHLERPEGSFAARSFGNAVHAFLELASHRIAEGQSISTLQTEMPTWLARIETVLRADGLPPAQVTRQASLVLEALENSLDDPNGRWILTNHPEAASEVAMTTSAARQANIRLDRTFRAGPTPGTTGTTHLWIVDYKTTSHPTGNVKDFLAAERIRYQPQLEGYARTLARLTPGPQRDAASPLLSIHPPSRMVDSRPGLTKRPCSRASHPRHAPRKSHPPRYSSHDPPPAQGSSQ